jgi:hypothetical protein
MQPFTYDGSWPVRANVGLKLLARNLPFVTLPRPEFHGRQEGPVVAGPTRSRPRQEADRRLIAGALPRSGFGDLIEEPVPATSRHSRPTVVRQFVCMVLNLRHKAAMAT